MRLAVAVLALLVLAPAAAAAPNVEIRRASHGIPHIKAKNSTRVGYGYGYAFAQDNICADGRQYVTVRAQRSRYFGPDETLRSTRQRRRPSTTSTRTSSSSGSSTTQVVEKLLDQPPPHGPAAGGPAGRARLRRRLQPLSATRPASTGIPDPRCRGKAVGRADHRDRRLPALLPARAARQPGRRDRRHRRGAAADAGARRRRPALDAARRRARRARASGCRSAASAPTRSRSAATATGNGRGMLLGNPHFPWDGSERFYQAQLDDPGQDRRRGRLAVRRAGRADRPHDATSPGATRSRPRSASRRSS